MFAPVAHRPWGWESNLDQACARHFDVVINATSVGMWPNVKDCLFPNVIPGDVVFDLVYNPLETELIRRARAQGRQVVPGVKMFIEQAVRQFEIWTGETAPRAAMEAAALDLAIGEVFGAEEMTLTRRQLVIAAAAGSAAAAKASGATGAAGRNSVHAPRPQQKEFGKTPIPSQSSPSPSPLNRRSSSKHDRRRIFRLHL